MANLPASYWANQIRAELQSTRSNLCSHGIRPEQCNDHRAELAAARDHANQPETEESDHA